MAAKLNGELLVRGDSLQLKENRNDRNQVVGHTVQIMKHGAKGYELLNVRLPEGANPENFKEGMPVELAIDISNFEGTLYYRGTRDLRADKPDNRVPPKSAGAV